MSRAGKPGADQGSEAARSRDVARIAVHEPSGSVVFAVAEGPGQGAVQVCRAALEQLLALMSRGSGLVDFERVAHLAVADWYETSLVAGVVQPEPGGPRVQVFRLGGSGAWLLDRATGSSHALFGTKEHSDSARSAPGTPQPPAVDPIEQVVEHLTDYEVLIVGGDRPVHEAFARRLAGPPTPLPLAKVLDFALETSEDDRARVVVWPAEQRAS